VPHATPEGELATEPVPLPERVTVTVSSASAKENPTLTGAVCVAENDWFEENTGPYELGFSQPFPQTVLPVLGLANSVTNTGAWLAGQTKVYEHVPLSGVPGGRIGEGSVTRQLSPAGELVTVPAPPYSPEIAGGGTTGIETVTQMSIAAQVESEALESTAVASLAMASKIAPTHVRSAALAAAFTARHPEP
jgi:hypothetical protein